MKDEGKSTSVAMIIKVIIAIASALLGAIGGANM
jgi:hypothetical protein